MGTEPFPQIIQTIGSCDSGLHLERYVARRDVHMVEKIRTWVSWKSLGGIYFYLTKESSELNIDVFASDS